MTSGFLAGFESCPACDGSGLAHNMAGEPDICRTCMGNTVVRTPAAREEALREALIELRNAWNNGLDTPEQNDRLMAKVSAALKLAGAP